MDILITDETNTLDIEPVITEPLDIEITITE